MIHPEAPEIKPRMPWPVVHHLDATLDDAASNVGLDEALLVEAEERGGPSVLRTWELGHWAVILGASGRIRDDVRSEACRLDGVEIARRSSGGGTVVVGPGALNFSVVLPVDADPRLKGVESTQRFVLERTAEALRSEGLPIEMLGSGDLTLGDRKFSGSAQRRLRDHVLVHASILYDFDLERIGRYTTMPARRPSYRRDRTHEEFVTNLALPRARVLAAIQSAWLPPGVPAPAGSIPEATLRGLVATKFSEFGWIERL